MTVFNENLVDKSLEIAKMLRNKSINIEVYLQGKANLSKQLKYAQRTGIKFVLKR